MASRLMNNLNPWRALCARYALHVRQQARSQLLAINLIRLNQQPPSKDLLIVSFLQKHDVYVLPASFNQGSRSATVLMAATVNPELVSNYALIKGQAAASKVQEWTSWKQWALVHPEWQEFQNWQIVKWKEERESSIAYNHEYIDWLENTDEGDAAIEKVETKITQSDSMIAIFFLPILLVGGCLLIYPHIAGNTQKVYSHLSGNEENIKITNSCIAGAPVCDEVNRDALEPVLKFKFDKYMKSKGNADQQASYEQRQREGSLNQTPGYSQNESAVKPSSAEDIQALRDISNLCAKEAIANGHDPSYCYH